MAKVGGEAGRPIEPRERSVRDQSLLDLGNMAVLALVGDIGEEVEWLHELLATDGHLSKAHQGIVDFLYATGVVNEDDQGKLVVADEELFAFENIQAAVGVRDRLRGYEPMRENPGLILEQMAANPSLLDTSGVPEELKGAMIIPVVANIGRVAEEGGVSAVELVRADWEEAYFRPIRDFLVQEELWEEAGGLTHKGKMLVEGPLAGYVELAYSYLPYFLNLNEARLHPEKCGFGKEINRWYPENSYASNRLIGRLLDRLIQMVGPVDSAMDLGSGGGMVLFGLAAAGVGRVYGLDISVEANGAAERVFNGQKMHGRLETLQGDLTNRKDLAVAAADIGQVEAALLNFLGHDLIGNASTREEGLMILEEFFHNFRELFPETRLYVTDSLRSDRKTLRQDRNPGRIMFALMHAVSPQYLLSREEIRQLLEKVGYRIEEEVVHVYHKPAAGSGEKEAYIVTFKAVPEEGTN